MMAAKSGISTMRGEKRSIYNLITAIMLAVLFTVILLLVVLSALSYQRSVAMQDEANNRRAVLSYIHTAVMADRTGQVSIEPIGDTDGIVILDEETGYEQRIYLEDGVLYENDGEKGSPVDTEESVRIGEAERFEAEYVTKNLIRIRTEQGETYVRAPGVR